MMDKLQKQLANNSRDKYESVYDIFEKIFQALCKCDAQQFSSCLQSVLAYMYGTKLISKDTYYHCMDKWNLYTPWEFIHNNPGKTISCFTSSEAIYTLHPEELIVDLLNSIISDKLFSAEYPGLNSELFKTVTSTKLFPSIWEQIYPSFCKPVNIIFTKKYVVWLIANKNRNNCKVYRKLWSSSSPESLTPCEWCLIYDCVSPYIEYDANSDIIRMRSIHINASIVYNLDSDTETIEYHTGSTFEIEIMDKPENGLIGNFEIIDGNLIVETDRAYNGKLYTKSILLENPHNYSGQVFYDCLFEKYIVKCPKEHLSYKDKLFSIFGYGEENTRHSIEILSPPQLGVSLAMEYIDIDDSNIANEDNNTFFSYKKRGKRLDRIRKKRILQKAALLGIANIVEKLWNI